MPYAVGSPRPMKGGWLALLAIFVVVVVGLAGSAILRSQSDNKDEEGNSSSSSTNPELDRALDALDHATTASAVQQLLEQAADAAGAEDGRPHSGSIEELREDQLAELGDAVASAGETLTEAELEAVRAMARNIAGYQYTGDAHDRSALDRFIWGLQNYR